MKRVSNTSIDETKQPTTKKNAFTREFFRRIFLKNETDMTLFGVVTEATLNETATDTSFIFDSS
jgi:hypothetical protein